MITHFIENVNLVQRNTYNILTINKGTFIFMNVFRKFILSIHDIANDFTVSYFDSPICEFSILFLRE